MDTNEIDRDEAEELGLLDKGEEAEPADVDFSDLLNINARYAAGGGLQAGDFDESKHPRDTHGRFGEGGGVKEGAGDSKIFYTKDYSVSDKVMVRTVEANFNTDQTTDSIKLVAPNTQGEFVAGGKTWQKGGQWDNTNKQVTSIANPEVLSHELGHAEFDYAKEQATRGLQDAAMRMNAQHGGPDGWTVFKEGDKPFLMRASGALAEPESPREHLFNAVLNFKNEHNTKESLPTEYAKSWYGMPIMDEAPLKLPVRGQSLTSDLNTMRTTHEAFAEYSASRALNKMQSKNIIDKTDVRDQYVWKNMDGPKGRAAYTDLQKAIDKAAAHHRDGL